MNFIEVQDDNMKKSISLNFDNVTGIYRTDADAGHFLVIAFISNNHTSLKFKTEARRDSYYKDLIKKLK